MKYLLPGLAITALLGATSLPALAEDKQTNTEQHTAVIVETIQSQPLSRQYDTPGRVVAASRIDIVPRVTGILEQQAFIEGSTVNEGELLFQIEKDSYEVQLQQRQADLASARANLKQAETDLKRYKTLIVTNAISESELGTAEATRDQAAAAVMAAKAGVRQAELDLGYTDIYSPITGRIGKATINEGNVVNPNSGTLVTVAQQDPIYVEIALSDKLLVDIRRRAMQLEENEKVIARLTLSDGKTYPYDGEFDFIDPMVSTETDTVTVRSVFKNPEGLLLPGQYVRVQIEPKNIPKVLAIPQSAVQRDKDGFFVMIVNDQQQVEQRRVDLSQQIRGLWVVKSGVNEGEQVITEGLQKVQVGETVNATIVIPDAE
ncbi:efflux RND transporter periplasmic adaptor subunit [Bacterioplanoides sp. SCSIO 12839]|uniref:efflux RND transporter periplasmic adaptor subunit n=1 Tax=Bacterioplanoides sp. SCSIO 12839 TaxID=2829569 RepID=UPI00210200E2|nr:efflux RND transporter periplasmic adaptor subunit [Bacterioplanoides sp. SCSIO 12839]UTW48159.1 efflux RND transporter periplasmic adaptor subunit [Bacterioplanoides sp. SCSIO 12839]